MASAMETARYAEWAEWCAANRGAPMGQHLQGFEYGFELGWAAGRAAALAEHRDVGALLGIIDAQAKRLEAAEALIEALELYEADDDFEDGSRAEVTALHWRWLDIRRAQDVPDPQFLLQQLQAWGAPWLVEPSDEEPATDDAVTERR